MASVISVGIGGSAANGSGTVTPSYCSPLHPVIDNGLVQDVQPPQSLTGEADDDVVGLANWACSNGTGGVPMIL
jgi:hypothetical protein